jgi:predicted nucleotidyltransferase
MNAAPLLQKIARVMQECGLEAVLVGNAAAALQGAPVTTLDFDFMFRETPANLRKLRRLADKLDGSILRPYYPASKLYRLVNDDRGIQLDFMSALHGIRSYEGLRSRASCVTLGGSQLYVAALGDVIRSKRALGRPRDKAVLEILEKTQDEKTKASPAEDTE